MRKRAEAGVRRIGRLIGRAVDAVIRFEQDGPVKRVEIVLHAPSTRDLVARAESRYFGIALTACLLSGGFGITVLCCADFFSVAPLRCATACGARKLLFF